MNNRIIINSPAKLDELIAQMRDKKRQDRRLFNYSISEIDFADLNNTDLSGITFIDVIFYDIKHICGDIINFNSCCFENCKFRSMDIRDNFDFCYSRFESTEILDSTFTGCDFGECTIGESVTIQDTTFLNCNFFQANFLENCHLNNANFMTSNLAVASAPKRILKVFKLSQQLYYSQIEDDTCEILV